MMRLTVPNFKKLSQSSTLEYSFSGTGVNVMSGLAHFGHRSQMLTRLPDNNLGLAAKSYLNSLLINCDKVVHGGNYLGMFFLEQGFGSRESSVTYTNRLESSFCTSSLSDYHLESALKDVDLIHFCGITLGVTKNIRDILFHIVEKAKSMGVKVSFDCNFRSSLWKNYEDARPYYKKMLELCDIAFLTEKDATYILGIPCDIEDVYMKREYLLKEVAKSYNIEIIAGTNREIIDNNLHNLTGFLLGNNFTYSDTFSCQVLDRIGGGDGFVSGILHGYLNNFSEKDIVNFGIASGVLAHQTYGDSPISSVSDVQKLLSRKVGDINR